MKTSILKTAVLFSLFIPARSSRADFPRVLPVGEKPADVRLHAPKDLDGYFPFTPPASLEAWTARAEQVRRRILVSQGLWPMPTKTPLEAVIHGKIDGGEYTVEKVYFQSSPGLFVTGNLYRPAKPTAKIPAVLFAHGHWQDARLSFQPANKLRQEIASGEERFESGGQSRFQSMCVQLARMGCIVWQWDMLSDSDAVQIPREVIHKFAKQRPEMNTHEDWGLYSPQAEAHLQSVMGLQTWNAVRSLDFVLSLPGVDPARIAITGASGGGTQTMLLAAVDQRVALSFPAVMVSTAMQGGCTCENASLLRIGTGNVEFAALFAPKPQGMTCADDWTKEMSIKGFPELQQLYKLTGEPKNVLLVRGEHFPHNYNAVSRSAFYTWLNRHFRLGFDEPVIERDFQPLSRDQLTVWDERHPAPKAADPEFERRLLKWFTRDAEAQLIKSLNSPSGLKEVLGAGLRTIIGREYADGGDIEWKLTRKTDLDWAVEMIGLLRNATYAEELPVWWLYPKERWNGKAVVWLTDSGKAGLREASGETKASIRRLAEQGYTVLGADLFMQGEFLDESRTEIRNAVVKNPREFAGYTYGYNHSLFARRTHDVVSLIRFLKTAKIGSHPNPSEISLVGLDQAVGPIAIAARSVLGGYVDAAAVDTHGFRFGNLLDYRDAMFLPGGAKYLDLPGMIACNAPHRLRVASEESNSKSRSIDRAAYQSQNAESQLELAESLDDEAVVDWLLGGSK